MYIEIEKGESYHEKERLMMFPDPQVSLLDDRPPPWVSTPSLSAVCCVVVTPTIKSCVSTREASVYKRLKYSANIVVCVDLGVSVHLYENWINRLLEH